MAYLSQLKRMWQPLSRRISLHLRPLLDRGFEVSSHNGGGRLEDGEVILTSGASILQFRVSRWRHEERVEFSWAAAPRDEDWWDIGYAGILTSTVTFEDYVRLPHELEAKSQVLVPIFSLLENIIAADRQQFHSRLLEERQKRNEQWFDEQAERATSR